MKIKVKEGERKRCLYQLVEYKAYKNKSSSNIFYFEFF